MALTGRCDGPALAPPDRFASVLDHLQREVGDRLELDVAPLLGERAALTGFARHGAVSCGGATRLLRTADGWCAVALARADDLGVIPAWLGTDADRDNPWPAVEHAVAGLPTAGLVERATLLGLACAALGSSPPGRRAVRRRRLGSGDPRRLLGAVVVDLSALWAGPLCAHLLQLGGARVIKVESTRRPDGARAGPPAFFDLLHAGQESVAIDFETSDGRSALAALLCAADVVVEASRPRALEQLGFTPAGVAARGRLRCWVSITGYGRSGAEANRVAFGDDAAVAGGVVAWDDRGPLFCADAVADPMAGLHAAAGVTAALHDGGRWLLDVSLHAAAGSLLSAPATRTPWVPYDASSPRARPPRGNSPAVGAHTAPVLAELAGTVP